MPPPDENLKGRLNEWVYPGTLPGLFDALLHHPNPAKDYRVVPAVFREIFGLHIFDILGAGRGAENSQDKTNP
jgi:hypothetical protein